MQGVGCCVCVAVCRVQGLGFGVWGVAWKVDVRLPGNVNSKLPWRKAGPPNHLDDKVDSDQ